MENGVEQQGVGRKRADIQSEVMFCYQTNVCAAFQNNRTKCCNIK